MSNAIALWRKIFLIVITLSFGMGLQAAKKGEVADKFRFETVVMSYTNKGKVAIEQLYYRAEVVRHDSTKAHMLIHAESVPDCCFVDGLVDEELLSAYMQRALMKTSAVSMLIARAKTAAGLMVK